jgi:hypothetical protein
MKKYSTVLVYGFLAVALAFGLVAVPASAADHLDAPGLTPPGGDTRLDITDVYAFQSPSNPANTVLVMGVNPLAGVLNDGTFHPGPGAVYEFRIDSDGDAIENLTYRVTFAALKGSMEQSVTLRSIAGKGGGSSVLASGQTGETISITGGGSIRAGVFDDPFFFDLANFNNGATFCGTGLPVSDFFLGLNISAIVLEVPSAWLGSTNVGVWAETVLNKTQIDRMGRPAINTVFIPNNPFEPSSSEPSQRNAFNAGEPRNDQMDFRGEVVDSLTLLYSLNDGTDPDLSDDAPTIQGLADFLLPDILTVDTSSTAGFPNGRQLADDVIDIELGLITEGLITSDCVANDSTFSTSFPYLAAANP